MLRITSLLLGLVLACAAAKLASAAKENIEFVAEHLPEVAMDNRYATLPLWTYLDSAGDARWPFAVTAGYALSKAGSLHLDGPMLALSVSRRLGERKPGGAWSLTAFAFVDDLNFSGGRDRRPLNVRFARVPPLSLPVDAEFSNLRGTSRNIGVGVSARRAAHLRLWGDFEWALGVIWQRVELSEYSIRYRVLAGAQAGATGTLDYSAKYDHVAPYVGLAWPRAHGNWRSTPHLQFAWPVPRRSLEGRITGPGFDVSGDTARAGKRKHFGDASLTVGWDVTYQPWHLTIDLGSALTQMFLERPNHEGVQQNWLLSARWEY